MNDLATTDCLHGVKLERVNYFDRQLLTADDMIAERDYFVQKLRRHNRFLHGWGVVCGLAVTAAPTSDEPWRVAIEPGYALGPYGDEIFVGEAFFLDLAKCTTNATTDPCEPNTLTGGSGTAGGTVYVAIKYAECLARPVLAMSNGCGVGEQTCEFSRMCDSFEVQCLAELPAAPQPGPSLCEVWERGVIMACPPCPRDPWVVLARVDLPATSARLASDDVHADSRRIVFPTTVLQEQLIKCCCEQDQQPAAPSVDVRSIALRVFNGAQNTAPFTSTATVNASPSTVNYWDYQVTLTGVAPAGGFRVTVTSSSSLATPIDTLVIPAGQTTATSVSAPPNGPSNTVESSGDEVDTNITITATGTKSVSATLVLEISTPK